MGGVVLTALSLAEGVQGAAVLGNCPGIFAKRAEESKMLGKLMRGGRQVVVGVGGA